MKDLKAIIGLLTRQKLRQIDILSNENALSTKTKQLYNGIKEGKINNDIEAAELLYNDSPDLPAYRMLKNRFKQRLINTVFFIDVQAYGKSAYDKTLNNAYKNWSAAKILMTKGMSTTAISLMETTLKSLLKYDIIDLTLLILNDLKTHYGLYNYNKLKFEKFKKLYKEVQLISQYKVESDDLYVLLGHLIEDKKSVSYDQSIKDLEKKFNKLKRKSSKIDSYYFRYNIFICDYFIHLIKKDLKKQLSISESAINYFKTKKGFNNYGIFTFIQINGIVKLSLKKFDESLLAFEECLTYNPKEGKLFWQAIYNYIFLIHILKKNYHEAFEVLTYVINHKAFKGIYFSFRQHWYIKEAFIHFLIKVKKIDPKKIDSKKLKQFRLGKFLNDTPSLTKDKRGYNITIQIIQILFLVINEKHDQLLDKMNSLKQYSFRHLKSKEFLRSKTFIKMLIKIPENNYELNKIRSKTKTLHQKLLSTPMDFSEQSMSIEIIPYEQLWEEILELLHNN